MTWVGGAIVIASTIFVSIVDIKTKMNTEDGSVLACSISQSFRIPQYSDKNFSKYSELTDSN